MILLHAAAVRGLAIGGPNASVPSLTSAQNRLPGVQAALVMTAGGEPPEGDFPIFRADAMFAPDGRIALPPPFDRPDLVVFHSTYIPIHAAIARRLWQAGIPYLVCPRGGMTRYAQRQKWLKKRIGNLVFFRRMVLRARALHCLTDREAEASQGWGRPVFVEGNGVDPPRPAPEPEGERFQHGPPGRRIVFVGRLAVQIKGLDLLLQAAAMVQSELAGQGARIELYGPDNRGSADWLAAEIGRLNLRKVVELRPPVRGDQKASLLARADAFLHTSRSEGHPMAVLEAMAFGVPCLVTPGTNMAEELVRADAGWSAEPTPAGIAAALAEVLHAEDGRLRRMGDNARSLALGRYHWSEVAARTASHYRRYAA